MLSWIRDLETCKTAGDVVGLARQCVEVLNRDRRLELPETCLAHEVRDVDDVRWWSERLSEEYWRRRGLGFDVESIQDAWSFFLRASIQITRLATRSTASA